MPMTPITHERICPLSILGLCFLDLRFRIQAIGLTGVSRPAPNQTSLYALSVLEGLVDYAIIAPIGNVSTAVSADRFTTCRRNIFISAIHSE